MALTLGYDELLRYTNEERDKWRGWLLVHGEAVDIAVQPGGRHATVGKMIDHIFLVERCQLQRLRGESVSESTGLTGNNALPLFDYGASVRRELEQFVTVLDEDEGDEVLRVVAKDRTYSLSTRKLLFHVLVHEIRHWAQIALAVRLAGSPPPGHHDLFYSTALR